MVRQSSAGLLVELKAPDLYPGIVADVSAALRGAPGDLRQALAASRLVGQSFDTDFARAFEELEPSVPVGVLGS